MRRILSLLVFLQISIFYAEAQKTGFEEFNGPYAGWANVKQRFGVKANGSADDTKGLEKALDELTVTLMNFNKDKDPYVTVYLPAGTYCISKTLSLRGKMGVNIIGEDPEKTIIKWVGGDDDTMFWANGSAYFKVSRIKWDAAGKKNIKGVAIQWKEKWNDGKTRSFASLNIEVSDCSFVGALQNGIIGGTYGGQGEDGTGSNDSEITIRRCSFFNCAIGIVIRGFNALDYWVWDCRFVNCEIGLRNKHGNYHLFRSHFYNSKLSDIVNIEAIMFQLEVAIRKMPISFW
ncbi:MAG: hypothetical protein IPP79_09650 [Chitinophagaceae bacterium]|nr:hypothetical protein [Chitinophagaceae bacterium]